MSKYRYYPAVGQLNSMACWAASLKWWYKAVMSINASQQALYDLYKHLATQGGGMTDAGIQFLIKQNAMSCIVFNDASKLGDLDIQGLLACGPLYVAYTETSTSKRHVNVIYEFRGSGSSAEVRTMEPQDHLKSDGTYTGVHGWKSFSDFNMLGSVYIGVKRDKYVAWVES